MRHKLRSVLRNEMHGGRGSGLRWLLRDEFTTDLAAGAVNGTAAEPGPGTRTVTDTESKITISADKLTFAGGRAAPFWGDPAVYYGAIERTPGRLLIASFVPAGSGVGGADIGFDSDKTSTNLNGLNVVATNLRFSSVVLGAVGGGTEYKYVIALVAAGFLGFIKGGAYTRWTYVGRWRTTDTTATLYPGLTNYNEAFTADFIRIPDALWLPTPLVSDGYGGSYGVSDGLGHAEGIAGGIGAGGSGVAWSNAGGTWSVSGGKAINTSPSGLVQQISVANLSCADVYAGASVVRALSQQVGLALNWDSASSPANGVLVYSDGTGNIKIDKYVSGSPTNVSTTAFTYSAGARLVVQKIGTEYRVYYNNALITTQTISDAGIVNNTLHGLFSTDASNTLDDTTIYATGTNGEYAELDKYSS